MIRLSTQTVSDDWIDNNGHMNVAYYTLAFDIAFDEFLLNHLGMGPDFYSAHKIGPFALQSNFCFLAEQNQGERFYTRMRILDFDSSKLHLFSSMFREHDDQLSATWEGISINVGLATRKALPFNDDINENIMAIYNLTRNDELPTQAGQSLGIRKKTS
jgi:acyl-CoA thioester hydrolase